jgi:hypothetical protein
VCRKPKNAMFRTSETGPAVLRMEIWHLSALRAPKFPSRDKAVQTTGSGNSDTVELIALPIFYRDNTSSFCIELIFHFVLFRVNTKVLAFSPHTDHSIYRLVISLVTITHFT